MYPHSYTAVRGFCYVNLPSSPALGKSDQNPQFSAFLRQAFLPEPNKKFSGLFELRGWKELVKTKRLAKTPGPGKTFRARYGHFEFCKIPIINTMGRHPWPSVHPAVGSWSQHSSGTWSPGSGTQDPKISKKSIFPNFAKNHLLHNMSLQNDQRIIF